MVSSSLLTAPTRRPQAPSSAPLQKRRSPGRGRLNLFGSLSASSSNYSPRKLSQQTLSRILLYILLSICMFYAVLVLYVARSSSSGSTTPSGAVKQPASSFRNAAEAALLLQRHRTRKQELVAQHDESDEHSIHHPGKIIIPAAEHHGRAHQEQLEDSQRNKDTVLDDKENAESALSQQKQHQVHHIDQDEHHDPYTIFPDEAKQISVSSSPYILKAFLEKIDRDSWQTKPLPLRTTAKADQLTEIAYPHVNSCTRLPELFPTDDSPVDADPFLPWIHDVFPTHDGRFIQVVAQNRRRCHSGTTPKEQEIIQHFQPQVSLFQHVPIKRVSDSNNNNNEPRYRLSSHEEADEDGMETRFICRFKPSMQETLSRHNFNYEYANWRKAGKGGLSSFTEVGHKDNKALHTSQLIFLCPVPTGLIPLVQSGQSVQNDWATLFLDIIPIRTPPRFGLAHAFFPLRFKKYQTTNVSAVFDPDREWGTNHILPKISDSGRWENLPICPPSHVTYSKSLAASSENTGEAADSSPPHRRLIACTWASSGYTTRGDRFAVTDGLRRLTEWIVYNLMIGFEHIYVYDNSPGNSTLQEVTDLFPSHQVTRIRWPAKVCNNHRNFDDSPGERSSQYAAESSCRLRFGPHADWIGNFDMDEYANPLGEYTNLQQILDRLDKEGTKIFSLKSWRAWPRRDLIEEPVPIRNQTICDEPFSCFRLKVPTNITVLQVYNCDRQQGPKKEAMPAEKQLFRADYVLQHFVHFSTVTVLSQMTEEETVNAGFEWRRRMHADLRHRFSNELKEATMLHAKAMATQDTAGWLGACTGKRKHISCRIGVPWPPGAENAGQTKDSKGWLYNCYVNEKIETVWVPRLEESLKKLLNKQS